ncbi:MAG: aminotransferase class I/II-fold pyridoxal phosphate-dependent enzyme [Candidatus Lokiarchaeota archaeon]|nr:aminotransferase class I/II-fold pyridoxal phosphate-dependent enzyme [Candidatus Lokiarchaeota archaeon]MBD3201153.1 aminotransferase class I/II-fold pyridoxal phosphate-dependent enzyme [Candidatus Lokiarchaeota archaeon]
MKINKFKLEEFFAKYEFNVKYSLCSSDCETFSVKELLALDKKYRNDLLTLRLGYTESFGNPLLREEIAKLYEGHNKDDILVFSGAEEAIFIFMNVLLDTNESVIVQFPAYQSLFEIAHAIGVRTALWKMIEDVEWDIDLEKLKREISSNTKCIVINFPHNPTGFLPTKDQFKEIYKIAQENRLYVLSDEVYRFLEFQEEYRLQGMSEIYDKGISLGVMSKAFGLAGLRIGWIATKDKTLLKELASFKNYTTICNSALSELFAIIALRNKDFILERNLEIIKENLDLLDSFFNKYSSIFSWSKPKAGSIAFPKILIDRNIEDICIELIKQKNVLLMPATKYDYDDKHFRIGFGRKNMRKALEKFEEFVKENLI